MKARRLGRDVLILLFLWAIVLGTHAGWEFIDEARQAKRYFYAMQGLLSASLLLALLYFSGRTISSLARALMYLLAIYGGTEESLVFACGANLYFHNIASPAGGQLCSYLQGWNLWIIGWCLALFAFLWWTRNVRESTA